MTGKCTMVLIKLCGVHYWHSSYVCCNRENFLTMSLELLKRKESVIDVTPRGLMARNSVPEIGENGKDFSWRIEIRQ